MKQYKHLLPEPVNGGVWKKTMNNEHSIMFEVQNDEMRTGLRALQLKNDKFECVLYINSSDENEITTHLAELITENVGFWSSFGTAKSMQVESAVAGKRIVTHNPLAAEMMLYYADKRNQFTTADYELLQTRLNEYKANQPQPEQTSVCALQ